ncbi:DUF2568 domain-containing protein [Gordonia sp. HY002]|uniref:DUF2568 domain-containing protein n=1 Tax=Gordonia zhenghanii TaxID=2911516 RepID=UPI001EEFF1F8|nr:DUF2568 domain-containing protein [Gordonia zhenghanii]MCF8571455.1 DUF2568 domain-containing protein [Gordonia zhenghanii]MCF8606659.1 DUF2568 domain-containing protein [Gordonia zhenghanii]
MIVYLWTLAGLLFAGELVMLAALGGSVWILAGRGGPGVAAGAATVAIAIAAWAVFASPHPVVDVAAAKAAVKIALYAGAAALLAVAGVRTSVVYGFVAFSLIVNIAAVLPPYRDF